MRRSPLAPCGLFLLALLAAAGSARAAADLASVTFTVATVRAENAVTTVTADIVVTGERIVSAAITPPGATTPIPLIAVGEVFALEKEFTTEADLAAMFPNGTYVLTLNGSTQIEFDYARAPVPSPAISAPLSAEILAPGAVTVEFTRCAICTEDTDSTEATILDAEAEEVASDDTLGPEDEIFPREDDEPIELAEDGSFTARIVHTVVRGATLEAAGDDFELAALFSHEDSVEFFTGSAVPTGDFCVVVEDAEASLDPLGDCLAIDEDAAALLDPSGSFETTVAGADVEYSADVLPSGEIVGSASADLDGNGSLETTTPLGGSLTGAFGEVERSISFAFRSLAPAAKLGVRIQERASVLDGPLGGTQRTRGVLLGAKVKETADTVFPNTDARLGWRLDCEVAGKQITDARITLSDGRTIPLTGRFLFDFLTDFGKLDLKSAGDDAGVRIKIEALQIDDTLDPPVITDGVLIFKILGQRGRFTIEAL